MLSVVCRLSSVVDCLPSMLALPSWTRSRHPIVRGETRHWQRSRVWRVTRALLLGGSLLFLGVPLLCPLLFNLAQPGYNTPVEAILVNGGLVVFGLAVASGVAGGLTTLLAGLLGATLISRERECQSWPFLRITTLTTLEIVGGKLAALFHTLSRTLAFVLGLRLLTLLAGVLTAGLALAASRLSPRQLLELWNSLAASFNPAEWLALQATGLFGLLLALAYWLLEPFFSVLYTAAVGLAASCVARSRGASIVLSIGAHFALGLGLYGPVQQFISLGLVLVMPNSPSPAVVGFLPVLGVTLPMIVQTALQAGVLALCLAFALYRAERLSE
jgi:hypothetical protein